MAEIAEADFDQLTDSIIYGEEIYVPADHFSGIFNTRADITTRILPDLSLDVTNATGNISLSFADGEIVDFGVFNVCNTQGCITTWRQGQDFPEGFCCCS